MSQQLLPPPAPPKRAVCARCARPAAVCLCAALPPAPIATAGAVIVLQHPNEAKRRLATVALLRCCLARFLLLRGRQVGALLRPRRRAPLPCPQAAARLRADAAFKAINSTMRHTTPPRAASGREGPPADGAAGRRRRRGLPGFRAVPGPTCALAEPRGARNTSIGWCLLSVVRQKQELWCI